MCQGHQPRAPVCDEGHIALGRALVMRAVIGVLTGALLAFGAALAS